jgi:hypothetical protein
VRAALVLLAVLSGCAPWHHVPTKGVEGWERWTTPPERIELTWHRVGHFEVQRLCRGGSPISIQPQQPDSRNGCAFVQPDRKACVIVTREHVTEAMVGHELLHCFLGRLH